MPLPRLSLVLLTSNDAEVVTFCLQALGRQRAAGFEVIVVDSGSTDGTVAAVRAQRASLPFPIRLLAGKQMPVGLARGLGVALARAALVAFVRPESRPGPHWLGHTLETLAVTDLAFRPAGPRRRASRFARALDQLEPHSARPARPGPERGHRRRHRTSTIHART